MNDDINGRLNDPQPRKLEAQQRGHFTHTLGLTGSLDPNYVSPRVALCRITNDLDRSSQCEMLWGLERRGYFDTLVIEVPDFQWAEDRVKLFMSEMTLPSTDKWTCFLTFELGIGDSAKLVFAFKNQVDRLLFSMEWPRGD